MRVKIINCDYAPTDMAEQLPIACELMRKIPGSDRDDYWLAKCEKAVRYGEKKIDYLVLATRFVGQTLENSRGLTALGVAYVTDQSLLQDTRLDFSKCVYVAICMGEAMR